MKERGGCAPPPQRERERDRRKRRVDCILCAALPPPPPLSLPATTQHVWYFRRAIDSAGSHIPRIDIVKSAQLTVNRILNVHRERKSAFCRLFLKKKIKIKKHLKLRRRKKVGSREIVGGADEECHPAPIPWLVECHGKENWTSCTRRRKTNEVDAASTFDRMSKKRKVFSSLLLEIYFKEKVFSRERPGQVATCAQPLSTPDPLRHGLFARAFASRKCPFLNRHPFLFSFPIREPGLFFSTSFFLGKKKRALCVYNVGC